MTPDIVALGEAMIEFNQVRPAVPEFLQGFGGDTSNAIIAAARQGAKAAYVTRIGADAFGDLLLDLWRREGVDTSAVQRDPQAPGLIASLMPDTCRYLACRIMWRGRSSGVMRVAALLARR